MLIIISICGGALAFGLLGALIFALDKWIKKNRKIEKLDSWIKKSGKAEKTVRPQIVVYGPLLSPFIATLAGVVYGILCTGLIRYIAYGVATAGFLLFLWILISITANKRREATSE